MRSRKLYAALRGARRWRVRVCDRLFGRFRTPGVLFATRMWERREYGSIYLVHKTLSKDVEPFFDRTCQALDLIKCTDPRAWRMVQREIEHIVNDYMSGGGEYHRPSRSCRIEFNKNYRDPDPNESDDESREWYVAALASAIVHEAVHGRLLSFGFPYNNKTWMREERICESRRRCFLQRVHSENYDLMALCTPFDPADWDFARNPALRRQAGLEVWRRFLRDKKKKM